jgi:hypothetical protein
VSQVANNVGFLPGSYGDQARPIEGTPGTNLKSRSYANPRLAQISTWTWTLSDTVGEVSATIRLPDGSTLTATGTDAGSTNTTHADTIVLAINTDDAWSNIATAENTAGVITVTFLHAGLDYAFVGFTAPGAGVLTATVPETQAAGGINFPVARWVVAAANAQDPEIPALALPGPGGKLVGVTIRPAGQLVNSGNDDNTVNVSEAFIPSEMVPVGFNGSIYVTNVGSVASVKDAGVFAVVNVAGGDLLGQTRADDDGANSEPAPAYWVDVVQPNERGRIYIQREL